MTTQSSRKLRTITSILATLVLVIAAMGGASAAVIEHAMGTTRVDGTPERIVTLTQNATESVLALGLTPVGAVSSWKVDPWYTFISERMEGATLVGGELEPELETIVRLQPDLILGSKSRHEAIYSRLSAIAPTIFAESAGMTWRENFLRDARAMGRMDQAEETLRAWDTRLADFKAKMGDRLAMEVSIVRFRGDGVRIYLTGFPGSIIRAAGLQRPKAQQVDDWATSPQHITIGKEQIPLLDADVLFYFADEFRDRDEASSRQRDEWLNHPLGRTLKVVRTGNVHAVDETFWNLSGGILSANIMLDDLYAYFLGE